MLPDVEPPTPSPLFPRNLADLFSLNPDEARTLASEYGLVRPTDDSPILSPHQTRTPNSASPDGDSQDREINLNRFMAHIGVRVSHSDPSYILGR